MKKPWLAIGVGGTLLTGDPAVADDAIRPDIVLILADDMGFSDIGCYGSEIHTPNIDRLAATGLRYTQFYNAARCCPTRASLLTGVYPHEAGMGWMNNSDVRTPAYRGDLGKDVRTIAEMLRAAGYATFMSGKWHVSDIRKDGVDIQDNWPLQRGFDRFYGSLAGAGGYFAPQARLGNEPQVPEAGKMYTESFSDYASGFIDEHVRQHPDQPFFLYLAYTAPHWPLHAKEETIARYKGRYDAGWDALRAERFARQKELGLWTKDFPLSPREEDVEPWETLSDEQRRDYARRMEIYAAQVDELDQGIGRVLAELEKTGRLDNTLIFFLSDNGACEEFISGGKSKDLFGDLSTTWESYRRPWANASNTPFRRFKHWVHEGGIRTPLIVRWPKGVWPELANTFVREPGHVVDLMATCIDVAGADYPADVKPLRGDSLRPHFNGHANDRGPIFWEHEANIAMRDGNWKLVCETPPGKPFDEKRLELYNMDDDPNELHNLVAENPERVQAMLATWTAWGREAGVFPLDSRDWTHRNWSMWRNVNGEFDCKLTAWDFSGTNGCMRCAWDTNSVLSGENSVRLEFSGAPSTNVAEMSLRFPLEDQKSIKLSFQSVASAPAKMNVRLETRKEPVETLAEQTVQLGTEPQSWTLLTGPVTNGPGCRLRFDFGTQAADTKIWIDAVLLEPF